MKTDTANLVSVTELSRNVSKFVNEVPEVSAQGHLEEQQVAAVRGRTSDYRFDSNGWFRLPATPASNCKCAHADPSVDHEVGHALIG